MNLMSSLLSWLLKHFALVRWVKWLIIELLKRTREMLVDVFWSNYIQTARRLGFSYLISVILFFVLLFHSFEQTNNFHCDRKLRVHQCERGQFITLTVYYCSCHRQRVAAADEDRDVGRQNLMALISLNWGQCTVEMNVAQFSFMAAAFVWGARGHA